MIGIRLSVKIKVNGRVSVRIMVRVKYMVGLWLVLRLEFVWTMIGLMVRVPLGLMFILE